MFGAPLPPRRFQYILFGIALGVCSFAVETRALAAGFESCKMLTGTAETLSVDSMPQPLREALREKVGVLVPPGQPFDSSDVVRGPEPHFQRLIFIWHRGERWVVATERGGRGYSVPVFSFDYRSGAAFFVEERVANREMVGCVADAMLTGTPVIDPAHR